MVAARRLQVWVQGSLRAGGNIRYRQHVQESRKDPCYVSKISLSGGYEDFSLDVPMEEVEATHNS